MIVGDEGRNQLYDNLVVDNNLKEDMKKRCMKIKNSSSLRTDEISIRRNQKMKRKNLYGTMVKNVSVAIVSVALSGLVIVGALNQIKKNNVSSGPKAGANQTIEVTKEGVTKITEVSTEIEESTEPKTEESTEVVESTYGNDKEIKSAIEQFSLNEDKWKNVFADSTGEVKYTMTDLDHNGNPEVIVGTVEGSGRYTRLHIYELVDGKPVDRIGDEANSATQPMSYPDLTLVDELPTYYNGARYIYIAPDYTTFKDGGEVTNYEDKQEFLLENGFFGNNSIAVKKTIGYEGTDATYTDSNKEKEITEDEFVKFDQIKYGESGEFEASVTKLKWVSELSDGNLELLDCYKVFAGEKN